MKKYITILLVCLGWANMTFAQDCDINELIVEQFECENGFFNVHLDFNVINPDGDLFGVMGNGTDYGSFPYDSLPITLGPLAGDGVTIWEFVVFDENNPDCQAVFVLGTVSCCAFSDVVVDPTVCTNMEVFSAVVNFNHANTGGVGFDVFSANGNPLGFFSYDDLPVTVTGIPSVGSSVTHITICDNDNEDCCTTVEFESLNCSPEDCEIFNVDILASECENGQFFVTLGFNFDNVSTSFTVTGNGNNYGTFSYDDIPILIGPFEGNGETVYEFVVTDSVMAECSDFAVLEPILCPEGCGFIEVVIDPLECQGDGYYALAIDFIPVEAGNAGFSVFTQGELLGSFSYEDLPVFIDSFPSSCNFFDVLTITDNADTSCSVVREFAALLCCDDCLIFDLIAEHTVCDSNDQFYVHLNFQFLNVSEEGFTVAGNGNNYGNFDYEDLPVILGPFDGDGSTFYEFVVTDQLDGLCFDATELGLINCACGFDSLVVDPLECTGNGTYSLFVNFVPVEVSNQAFDVFAGNDFVGFFLYEDLPITIENFPDGSGSVDVITICDNDNPSCCTSLEFEESLNCGCDIFDLVADAFECDSASNTFALYIDFEWEGNIETFNVYKGDLLIGTVNGANLPDTLYGLTDDGGGALISVCAVNFPDCCAAIEIDVPQCGAEPCDIIELVAEAFDCDTATNTFALYLDFQWTGSDEAFNVFKGNVLIGTVLGANLPDTITGLTDDGGGALITVCATNHPDCCGSQEIAVPDCGEEEQCEIFEVGVDTGDCTSDSTFQVAVVYSYQGFTNEFVELWTGDTYLGLFHIDIQPIVIMNFPWNGQQVMPLRICQNDHPDCCRTIEFEVPQCGSMECGIFELVVDPVECTTDSTFAAWVNYNAIGFDGNVQIWAGDSYLGVYPQITPLLLLNIPEDDGGILLTVCQAENENCCAQVEFEGMICENVCSISNLTATVSECEEGTFTVTLDFDFMNVGDSFAVIGNGTAYGIFSYNQLPLTLGPFEGDTSTQWEFAVFNLENPFCVDFLGLGVIDCTTGISDPVKTFALEMYYHDGGAYFNVPAAATEFSMWTYDGRRIASDNELTEGERIHVSKYIPVPGLYFIQVRSADRVYVGKVVGF